MTFTNALVSLEWPPLCDVISWQINSSPNAFICTFVVNSLAVLEHKFIHFHAPLNTKSPHIKRMLSTWLAYERHSFGYKQLDLHHLAWCLWTTLKRFCTKFPWLCLCGSSFFSDGSEISLLKSSKQLAFFWFRMNHSMTDTTKVGFTP